MAANSKNFDYRGYTIEIMPHLGGFQAEVRNAAGTVVHRLPRPEATREAAEGEAMQFVDSRADRVS